MTADFRLLSLSLALVKENHFPEALQLLDQALARAPEEPDILLTKGYVLRLLGKIEEGEPYFAKANVLDPNRPFTLAKIGQIEFWRGDYTKAMQWFEKAIQAAQTPPAPGIAESTFESVEQTSILAYCTMIQNLAERDLFDEMAQVIRKATEEYGEDSRIQTQAFSAWFAAGDLDKAIHHLSQLLRLKVSSDISQGAQRHLTLCKWAKRSLEKDVPQAAESYSANGKPPLVIAITVWGESYVSDFLNFYIRTMLSPGNLPALSKDFDVRFVVLTTGQDQKHLERAGVEEALSPYATVHFFTMPGSMVVSSNHLDSTLFIYRIYILTMHIAISYAQAIGAAINLGVPDAIIADGSFKNLARWATEDKKEAVFAQGLVVNEKTFPQNLSPKSHWPDPLTITAEDLMAEGAKHLHPLVENRVVCPSNNNFSDIKSAIFWWTKDGLVGHLFHWHPIFISSDCLKKYKRYRFVSIDAILPHLLFPDSASWDQIHLVTQSDDFGFVTLGPTNKAFPTSGAPFTVYALRRYHFNGIDVRNLGRWMFRHKVTYRGFLPANIASSEMAYDPEIIDLIGEPSSIEPS